MTIKQIEIEVVSSQFRVKFEARLQHFRGEHSSRHCPERSRERLKLVDREAHTGRHFVAAKLKQILAASFQRIHKRQARNTPSAPFSFTEIVKADHNRRAMELFGQPRRDDTNDTRMPPARAGHDRKVALGYKVSSDLLQDFIERLLLERLPVAVLPIQAAREQSRFIQVIGKQQ